MSMAQIFLSRNLTFEDPMIFSTPGKFSMETAVELLSQLEQEECFEIENDHLENTGHGDLVETGIVVFFENISFRIMCSYEDILVYRLSGNKKKFYEVCNKIREMDFSGN